jgi:hypothetical protein
MTDQQSGQSLLATTQGKIVTALVVVAVVLAVVSEGISLVSSYQQMRINKANADAATMKLSKFSREEKTDSSSSSTPELQHFLCEYYRDKGQGNGRDCEALRPKK